MDMPECGVRFQTADAGLQRLWDDAERKCRGNLRDFGGDRILTEGGGYEKIWLETQPMGGEMYALRDMRAAVNNSLLFMRHQRADGRLPGSVAFADGRQEAQFDKLQGFCFPWHALNLYYLTGRDPLWLERLADCLARFDAYLWARRDSNGDGLLESFCVYDTGEDGAVRYGDAPCRWEAEEPPEGCAVVPMASMDVMSWSYAARATLAKIGRLRADGTAEKWAAAAADTARALRRGLWDERTGAFFDRDRAGRRVDVLAHNTLRCLYWGSVSKPMADRFVREHLLNAEEFWTPLPLPSVAVCDPAFRNAPENNWSGQCEGLTYQRAVMALENYGWEEMVTRLGRRFLRALREGGCVFAQQFDPFTGAPSRVGLHSHRPLAPGDAEPVQDAYGPTMLAALEYAAHLWGVDLEEGKVLFSLASAGAPYRYEARWNGHVYVTESDGVTSRALCGGREVYCGAPGVRVVTDEEGRVERRVPVEGAG